MALEAGGIFGGVRGWGRPEGNRAGRRSEERGLEGVDGTFGGVRGGRRRAGGVLSRLGASRGGVGGFGRCEGGFGCGLAVGPFRGGVEGGGGGLVVLGTGGDSSSLEAVAGGLGVVVLGWAEVVGADVQRGMRIRERPMVRMMDRSLMDGAVHPASLRTPKRGDGREEVPLIGSSLRHHVAWVWARGSLSA